MTPIRLESTVIKLAAPRQLVFEKELLGSDSLMPRQILAETLYSAISVGTELAAYRGDPPLRPGLVYPRLVGYCNVAEVTAIGAAVDNCLVGDYICTRQSHRSAFICNADEVLAKPLPTMDAVDASTTYLFHLGYNALLKGGFTPGHRVAVIGLGVLGLAAVATASAFGGIVHAYSNQENARAVARELGAAQASEKQESDAESGTKKVADADLVITTSNSWSDWRLAMKLCRKEGSICVLGFPGRGLPEPDFNPLESQFFYDKQLRIIACGISPNHEIPAHDLRFTLKRNFEFLLDCIRTGKLPARRLVAAVEPYQMLPKIYGRLEDRGGNPLTYILKWK